MGAGLQFDSYMVPTVLNFRKFREESSGSSGDTILNSADPLEADCGRILDHQFSTMRVICWLHSLAWLSCHGRGMGLRHGECEASEDGKGVRGQGVSAGNWIMNQGAEIKMAESPGGGRWLLWVWCSP